MTKEITLRFYSHMVSQICPVCSQPSTPVYVHGHYQCNVCGINISPCCDGAQCEGTATDLTIIHPFKITRDE